MNTEIPQWIIEYDRKNYQSSAGKAIRFLLEKMKTTDPMSAPKHTPTDSLREKIIQTLNRLRGEGKNIYAGVFCGAGDPANVQLSCTKTIDGDTYVTDCFYSAMYQFAISPQELKP